MKNFLSLSMRMGWEKKKYIRKDKGSNMMMYVWLIVGFILLIKGADFFVEGSSSVAKLLRIPSVIIGLTIVAFGTSAPEAAVSITAALAKKNEIAIGNVIGSNIFNLLMVLGCCSLILPLTIDKKILFKDYPFSLVITGVLLAAILFDLKIGRLDGFILFVLFGYFLVRTVQQALSNRTKAEEEDIKVLSPFLSGVYILGGLVAIVIGGDLVVDSASEIAAAFGLSQTLIGLTIVAMGTSSGVYILGGLVAIVIGGDLVVDSASEIAAAFGLSQTLIGLTIVAMGTSLPELVTSMVAAKKGENGLALGNVVGSNIFNILLILSVSSMITPIPVQAESIIDLIVLLATSAVCWIFCKSKYTINRIEGGSMVLMYAGYMAYIIAR